MSLKFRVVMIKGTDKWEPDPNNKGCNIQSISSKQACRKDFAFDSLEEAYDFQACLISERKVEDTFGCDPSEKSFSEHFSVHIHLEADGGECLKSANTKISICCFARDVQRNGRGGFDGHVRFFVFTLAQLEELLAKATMEMIQQGLFTNLPRYSSRSERAIQSLFPMFRG